MKLVRGLSRRLTYANVIASIALFAALSGGAYAATTINGNSIKSKSIGGGKLKNETITSKQIKKGSLNSSVIDISTLTTVPSATTATSAQTAQSATTSQTAESAKTADTAKSAETAKTADRATSANSADSATTAQTATTAANATEADHAKTADDADTLEGESASDLILSCASATDPYGGVCWDKSARTARNWFEAVIACGDDGGHLPSLGELIAYIAQEGQQVSGHNWSDDTEEFQGGFPKALTADEVGPSSFGSKAISLPFRCVFYPTN